MAGRPARPPEFDDRELLALMGVANGETYVGIARRLTAVYGFTPPSTIISLLRRMRIRIHAATNAHMVHLAYQRGDIRLSPDVIQRFYSDTKS